MMDSKVEVTFEHRSRGGSSSSLPIVFDDYGSLVERLAGSLEDSSGLTIGHGLSIYALTAAPYLATVSRVRRHKGFSRLYLSDDVRSDPNISLVDGYCLPKSDMDLLYAVVSGSTDATGTVMKLGLQNASSFLVSATNPADASAISDAVCSGVKLTERSSDEVAWDHSMLLALLPQAVCVAGLVGLPFGPMRLVLAADENFGSRMISALTDRCA